MDKVHEMVYFDGNTQLDLLYEKSLLYQHHRENYQTSLLEGLTTSGSRIKKRPAINAIFDTFEEQWNFVPLRCRKEIGPVLLQESESIATKLKYKLR